MSVVIGIDVGTTTAKVIAVDTTSSWRVAAFREYQLAEPHPRWQVQNPAMVLDAVDRALAEVVVACGGRTVDVIGVGSAMHGLVALDEDLRPLTDIITWADTRAYAEAAALRAEGRARELLHLSGTPVHPMSPLVKLRWFAANDTSTAGRAHRWAGLKDLVLLHLTGKLVTELSTASASGLLDLGTRTWADSTLDLAGLRREQLPEVLPTTALLELSPQAAERVGLPAGIPVNTGATDGPLGNLGTGAIEPGIAGLSMGTSGAVRTVVPEPRLDEGGRLFCYALTDDAWVTGAAISNGGVVARWAGEVYAPDVPPGPLRDVQVLAMAEQVPAGSDGLVMLPYLLGERAPLWDPELTGAFLGVRHAHGRGHFIRAAIEGVALQMASIVDVLDSVTPITEVRCTGGVFRADLWRTVMAATVGRPLVPTDDAEGSALGSAILALYATGRAESLAAGLEMLSPRGEVPDPITVLPEDRTAYAGLRGRAAHLLGAYDELQAYLEALEPSS
ncbi:gluconokinase [Georgenia sp. H159]|uniref:gluconokinase n=1 Tax=Georgenia sp. H159 TaxID=3076115 RepID=UPI002D78D2D4|nr:gluconokinase [Georgenia sp. H159]